MANEFVIGFQGLASADANVAALRLRESLLDLDIPEVDARVERESGAAMDFGTSLVLVLGAPAAVAVARGIAQWLAREGERAGELFIKTKAGSVLVKGSAVKNIDVAATVSALTLGENGGA
jgi:hypothetical protein